MTTHTDIDFHSLIPSDMDASDLREVMGACISPRPVALITTLGPGGVLNAAPFCNFMGVATEPCLVAFALGRRAGEEKDTLKNIRETPYFVVNAVSVDMAEAMHHTAADYARNRSEAEAAGFQSLPGAAQPVPRIAEAPIQMECRVHQIVELPVGDPTNALIVGEVLRVHVWKDVVDVFPLPVATKWEPLGGIGDDYMLPGDTFSLPYPCPKDE
ncbi:MAG TPA: flavin reductase family protein [Armatimonadota bacterium]|jgi:flavin reductase (DIM6/NTAB) family NADH-FMN oxidoreductase RutF